VGPSNYYFLLSYLLTLCSYFIIKQLNVLIADLDVGYTIIYITSAWVDVFLNNSINIILTKVINLLKEFLFSELLLGLRAFSNNL
jgi:hypothetical protein